MPATDSSRQMQPSRESLLARAQALRWELGERFHDSMVEALYEEATRLAARSVRAAETPRRFNWEMTLDRLVTGRWTGFPIMFLLLAAVFWITIVGANYPSQMLSFLLLETLHPALKAFGAWASMPWWLSGFLFDGVYLAVAWVVSVMLPPMAIFFPLFTLLEDFGYLPRVAFNTDSLFRKVGAHGKQALTMAMGYGCNAAGVVATRIIDSPRERLIAILTNNFSLCNGRWPTQILIATIFIGALAPLHLSSAAAALAVVAVVLIGIGAMFFVSWGLSRSLLKGEASMFTLELPPYRPPRLMRTLYTSLIDRTVFVLMRAVMWALPAGALIWLVSNVHIGEVSIAARVVGGLDPVGLLFGLNGVILLAYIIAIPANEIVIPTILMLTALVAGLDIGSGAGVMFELDSASATAAVLQAGGWTVLTGVNLMLFSLLHNPCSTTLHTIYKETGSAKWTVLSALIPLVFGFTVCFFVAQVWRILP